MYFWLLTALLKFSSFSSSGNILITSYKSCIVAISYSSFIVDTDFSSFIIYAASSASLMNYESYIDIALASSLYHCWGCFCQINLISINPLSYHLVLYCLWSQCSPLRSPPPILKTDRPTKCFLTLLIMFDITAGF